MGLPPTGYAAPPGWAQNATDGSTPAGTPMSEKTRQFYAGAGSPGMLPADSPGSRASEEREAFLNPEETYWQQLVRGSNFQNLTLAVIVANGLWIGVDVEWNHPKLEKNGKQNLDPWATIIENIFCVYFTAEILMRVKADGWAVLTERSLNRQFIFDFVLVAFMVIETWIMAILELIMGGGGANVLAKFSTLRLLRLSRLARVTTFLPELMTLIKGILAAAKAVSVVMVLLVILLYIFAIFFTSQIGEHDAWEHDQPNYWDSGADPVAITLFGDMGSSMMTLFTRGLLGDNLAETLIAIKDFGGPCEWGPPEDDGRRLEGDNATGADESEELVCTRTALDHGFVLMWVFIVFMCISAFCLLNMLIGILCQVIDDTAKDEREANRVISLEENIKGAFWAINEDGDAHITKKEWIEMKTKKAVLDSFEAIGFTEDHIAEQMDEIEEHLFGALDKTKMLKESPDGCEGDAADDRKVAMAMFVQNILEIRPDKEASYLDLFVLQTRAKRDEMQFNKHLDRVEQMLARRMNGDKTAPAQAPVASPNFPPSPQRIEEPKIGTSSVVDPWLQELPTDVLFAELKHRAAQKTVLLT